MSPLLYQVCYREILIWELMGVFILIHKENIIGAMNMNVIVKDHVSKERKDG